jgi:hypothetical protein
MFYTVIKLDGHLKTRVFSNVRRVLSQHKTSLTLLYLLYDIDLYHEKQVENNKTCSSDKTGFFRQSERALDCIFVIYSDKTGFFSQSERALDCIFVIYSDKTGFFSQSERALDCIYVTKRYKRQLSHTTLMGLPIQSNLL